MLSKSMEKIFQRMKSNKEVREAYVEAEIISALAHQIRAMRLDRKLSQAELAKKMKTTQAAISRLEDPSYGQLSLQTLFKLSHAFDTGLRVEFVSTLNMLNSTFKPNEAARHVPSFEDESENVAFYSLCHSQKPFSTLTVEAKTLQTRNISVLSQDFFDRALRCKYLTSYNVNTDEQRDEHKDHTYNKKFEKTATIYTNY